jgi:hypothetical protein
MEIINLISAIRLPYSYINILDFFVNEHARITKEEYRIKDVLEFIDIVYKIHLDKKVDYFWFDYSGKLQWSERNDIILPTDAIYIDREILRDIKIKNLLNGN